MFMKDRRAFTLIELLVVIAIISVLAAFLMPTLSKARQQAKIAACKSNLRQLGMSLTNYLDTYGASRYFPYPMEAEGVDAGQATGAGEGFSGAAFLAALYWSGTVTEPGIFLCPSSDDDNHKGEDYGDPDDDTIPPGSNSSRFGEIEPGGDDTGDSSTPVGYLVSFASRAQWRMPGDGRPLTDRMPSDTVMASDDTQGTENHTDGFCVLFADGHVEWLPSRRIGHGAEGLVGQEDGDPLDMVGN